MVQPATHRNPGNHGLRPGKIRRKGKMTQKMRLLIDRHRETEPKYRRTIFCGLSTGW